MLCLPPRAIRDLLPTPCDTRPESGAWLVRAVLQTKRARCVDPPTDRRRGRPRQPAEIPVFRASCVRRCGLARSSSPHDA